MNRSKTHMIRSCDKKFQYHMMSLLWSCDLLRGKVRSGSASTRVQAWLAL